jgi:glycosyltransferase involved in cell wall biosynthesis
MPERVRPRRILFARSVDAANINAQSRNAKEILRRWSVPDWRPTAIAFGEADKDVAANPHVDLIRISPDRWWRARLWQVYQGSFDAIVYPGMHHSADYFALRTRLLSRRRVPIISTIEGLSGSTADESREAFFSAAAGHRVYCQKLAPAHLSRVEWISGASDHIIALSPFLVRMAEAKYGNEVSCVPLGIALDHFSSVERARFDRPVVVTAGNLGEHKRPDFFLSLAEKFPQADFKWFGDGPLRKRMAAEAKRLGLMNLDVPGSLNPDRLAAEFGRANLFVLTSRSEGVPKVSQEAAAAGLAQIVFGFYEAPSVVDGGNGFVVWDDEQFAARLKTMIDDPALASRMGDKGRTMAAQWSWDRVALEWQSSICGRLEKLVSGRAALPVSVESLGTS